MHGGETDFARKAKTLTFSRTEGLFSLGLPALSRRRGLFSAEALLVPTSTLSPTPKKLVIPGCRRHRSVRVSALPRRRGLETVVAGGNAPRAKMHLWNLGER